MIYKTRQFQKVFKKSAITDEDLAGACQEMAQGLIDADLGDYLYKKRVAMPSKGKSGGFRTMIGAVIGERYFFLYMFAKSAKSNVTKHEKLALKEMAKEFISFDQATIHNLVVDGELLEVRQDHE